MNLDKDKLVINESSLKYSETDIDAILETFALPISQSSPYFQFDLILVKQYLLSLKPNERSSALVVIFDFLDLLDLDYEESDIPTSLRQMIAISYFIPQLSIMNNYEFLNPIISTLTKINQDLARNKQFAKQYSASIPLVLSKLDRRIRDINICHPNSVQYQQLLDLSLQIYEHDEIINERDTPKVMTFFFNSLLSFRGNSHFTSEQCQLVFKIAVFLSEKIIFAVTCPIDCMQFMHHIFSLLINNNPLSMCCKFKLTHLLSNLTKLSGDVSKFLFNPTNAGFIVHFITLSLQSITFEYPTENINKDIKQPEILTKKYQNIQSEITRTFEDDFPTYSDDERKDFAEKRANNPEIPIDASKNKDILYLIKSICNICSIREQEKVKYHLQFMKDVLQNRHVMSLPISSFFLATWVCQFLRVDIGLVSSALHKMNFYTTILEKAFLKYDDQMLKDFIIDLIIYLTHKAHTREPYYLSDLMLFTIQQINRLNVPQQLLDGLAKSVKFSSTTFVNASFSIKFGYKLAECLNELFYIHSTHKTEEIVETRTRVLKFVDRIDSYPLVFQYLFEEQLFLMSILSHFYDRSTINFAARQLLMIFQQFSRKSNTMNATIKFFESFNVDETLIKILLNCSTSGYENNPVEIAKLFSETNFLDFLIDSSRKLNSDAFFFDLVELFSKMTTNKNYSVTFDAFLRLANLVPKDFDLSLLWKIVFEDDLNDSEPRKIKNVAPISLLFDLKIKSNEVEPFLVFLSKCIELDPDIKYSISYLDFSSQILTQLSEYRTKENGDEKFDILFNMFYSLSLYSLKSQDFKSLFRLCASRPDHSRPFFTLKVINMISELFTKRWNIPTSFFSLSGDSTHLQLPEISIDVINTTGFHLSFDAYIDSDDFDGKIFEFTSSTAKLSLEWNQDHFSFIVKTETDDQPKVFTINEKLGIKEWTTIDISYTPTSLSIMFSKLKMTDTLNNNPLTSNEFHIDFDQIEFNNDFSYYQALVKVPCQVCRILCMKEPVTREFLLKFNSLPRARPISFHESEKSSYDSHFSSIFESHYENDVLYMFYASVVSGQFAVSLTSPATLRVTGNVYNHEPEPSFLLDLLGGISCLIPFFGQIESVGQETIAHQSFDKDFLPNVLNLLSSVFSTDETLSIQKDFHSIHGNSILAFLLSICSLKTLENDDVITSIGNLFRSMKYPPLIIDFVDNILFNFKLWIYLPFNFQTRIYLKFYELLFENLNQFYHEGINASKILMLMRVYLWNHNSNRKICLGDEPKFDVVKKNIEGQRPSDCTALRNIFWEIVKQMAEKYMTDEDVSLLISFCCETLDLQFSYEAISLFTYFIQISNQLILKYMKTDYAFSPLFELLKLPNSVTQNRVIQIFLLLDQQYLKPFPLEDWYNAIITTIAYQTIDEGFVKEIEKEMIRPVKESLTSREPAKYHLSNSSLIPLFLLSIQQLNEESILSHFNLLCDVIQSGLKENSNFLTQIDKNWDYPFLMFLMSLIPNNTDQISELGSKCIKFLVDVYIKSTRNSEEISEVSNQKLLTFPDFIYLMIHKSKHNYVHIIRLLYTQFLEVENIKIKPVTSISTYMFYKIYCKIFEYIVILPKVDIINNEVPFNFQDLYKMSLEKKKHSPKFVYAVRHSDLNDAIDWTDVGIVKLLIISLMDRSAVFGSTKHDEFEPSYILGSLLSSGLQLPKYLTDFLNLSDSFLQFVLNSEHLKSYKNALIEVFSGLVEINESKKEETTDLIYTNTILFADILSQHFRIAIPSNLTSSSEFDISLLNPLVEISKDLDVRFQKAVKSLIMMKEMKIAKMARDCRGEVQITRILKPGEMTYEVALRTQLEQFALTRKQLEATSIKNYKEIFNVLSSENGPWQTVEIEKETHRKLSQKINGFCRFFMKPNYNFEDHKVASIARDVGNLQDAIEIYQREYAQSKMTKFRGDLALIAADRKTLHNFSTQTDQVFLKLGCRWVTIKKNYSGTLSLLKNMLVFDSSEHFARIPLDSIIKIFQRHYILLDTALEIFTSMKKSFFFDFFDEQQRRLFIQMICEFKPANLKFIQVNSIDIKPLIQRAVERWQRGELTNFQYLLKLNKYAGRSYQDLSQYPVFPWVLQDYTSESLDFDNPKIYRDLGKPIGTYTSERLENLKERIIGAKKFDPDSYYLYGALYSSSAVVIGYLIRLEPFTTLHITLQSQKFDFADRLFNDIPSAWESVTSSPMDFRELIPEFFYFPDFLVNENKFDLGKEVKTGSLVGDVRLPKWAKSPQDFILKNRMALESKYVTSILHKWIDLIFGPKSRGSLSELNDNFFHPYFYETTILGADEKRLKMACEFAACFGEVALQIFDGEPPKKTLLPSPFMNALLHIQPSLFSISKHNISKIAIPTLQSLPLMIYNLSSPQTNPKTIISILDTSFNFYMVDLNNLGNQINGKLKMIVPSELEDICQLGQKVAICSNSAVATVPWDPGLFYFRLDTLLQPSPPSPQPKDKKAVPPVVVEKTNLVIQPTAIQRLHNVTVTAIAMNEDYIVSGSKDSTLRIWKHSKNETDDQACDLKPVYVIAKHQCYISAVCINQHLRVCYSISVDGFLMATSLLNGSYMNGVQIPVNGDPVSIITSDFGDVVVAVNGTVLESKIFSLDQNLQIISEHSFNSLILDMEVIHWCDGVQYLVLAMRDGIARIYRLPFLDDTEMSIRASNYDPTTVSYIQHSKTLLIGDSEGKIHSYKFSGM